MSSSKQKEKLKEAQKQLVPITSHLTVNKEDAYGGAAAMSAWV